MDRTGGRVLASGHRLGVLLLAAAVLLLVPAARAAAEGLTVTLGGSGTGTVVSEPPGIDCSNTPGHEKLSATDCSHNFGILRPRVKLRAKPDAGQALLAWGGSNAAGCNAGYVNPCQFTYGGFGYVGTASAEFGTPPPLPSPTTGAASDVGETSAGLQGAVDGNGNGIGDCGFEYGTTIAYGAIAACSPRAADLGTGANQVSAEVEQLEPGVTYHYRLTALNPAGTARGGDRTFTTSGSPGCPNSPRRLEQGIRAILLPSCMALEMVSPPSKFNQTATQPDFSANGERISFVSLGALGETPKLSSIDTRYLSSRTPEGWVTSPASAPAIYYANGQPCGYSPDLSRWNTQGSTATQARQAITTALWGGIDRPFEPISPLLVPPVLVGKGDNRFTVNNGFCEGGSVDASHELFALKEVAYLPGDPVVPSGSPGMDVYEAHLNTAGAPTVELLQRDKDGVVYGGKCGAIVGSFPNGNNKEQRGSVSIDASRIYFTTYPTQPEGTNCNTATNKARIMRRVATPGGPEISELASSECTRVSPACSAVDGDDKYMGASQEGHKVYFTTPRQLTDSDLDTTSDLYLHDADAPAGSHLTQVSMGDASDPTPGSGAGVLGVADFAGDGSRVYFVATGVLTTAANPLGSSAQAGQPNLYMWERDAAHTGGRTAYIGTLASADRGTWDGPGAADASAVPTLGADPEDHSIGGDGHVLVFLTAAPLRPGDTDGVADAYRYDADAGSLTLVSKAPPGGEENGPEEVSGVKSRTNLLVPNVLFFQKWVSEDGETVVFSTNTRGNAPGYSYVWHDGAVTLLPGTSPAVSGSGDEVAFATATPLVPQDGDNAIDVYVGRSDGGFLPPSPPTPCVGEACQGAPSPQPVSGSTATSQFAGPGNPKTYPKRGHKKTSKKHRAHRHKKGKHKKRGARRASQGKGGRR